MRTRIKHVSRKARSYAKYIIAGLAVLLFLSVFRASVFDKYLFSYEEIAFDSAQQGNFIKHLEEINPSLAAVVRGAGFSSAAKDKRIDIIKDGVVVAYLEVDGETMYLAEGEKRTAVGVAKEENGKINVYAGSTPESEKIWFEISFILLIAISAELLVSYVKQPAVMVLLILGIIISPSAISLAYPALASAVSSIFSAFGVDIHLTDYIPHIVPTDEGSFISIFAKLGSIFLLFGVGLHSEINRIFNRRNFLVALAGVILPFLGGYFYAGMTGHNFAYSLFLGAALTATSVGVTVAVLQEFKVLDMEFAKVILGAA